MVQPAPMEHFTLATGSKIPAIAFGSGSKWRVQKIARGEDVNTLDEKLTESVKEAILAGFTHLDTAEAYQTHREICEGIKRSGVDRSKLWITTKYFPGWRGDHAMSKNPYEAIEKALKELETDYIDVYLIHNPFFNLEWTHGVTVEQAWADLERAYEEGLVKHIGISNFPVDYYNKVLKVCKIKPMVLQLEMHPYCYNQHPGIVAFAKEHGAQVEAYGTLTPILRKADGPLTPLLDELSKKYNKTPAQLILRWIYQNDVIPLTTSGNPQRLREALDIFTFELTQTDVNEITRVGASAPYREYFKIEWGPLTGN